MDIIKLPTVLQSLTILPCGLFPLTKAAPNSCARLLRKASFVFMKFFSLPYTPAEIGFKTKY